MIKIVFFDVDNVLVKGQTQKLLLNFLFKKRKIGCLFFLKLCLWFLLYKFNLVKDTTKIRRESFKLMKNWDEEETKKLFKEFFDREIRPHIFPQSIKLIKTYIKQGCEVVLTSSSIFEIVDELKKYLFLKFTISTKLEIIDGKYTGRVLGKIPYGENKVTAVKNFLNNNGFVLEKSYAYADHYSDLPLLDTVTNPVVINPDRRLRKIAKERKWNIYDFK
jgi:HAD superfamily hydrolase (TIGR01490 family)